MAFHDGLLSAIQILIAKLDISIDLSTLEETGIPTGQAVLDFATPKGTLHAADYLPGTRYNALAADLAFWENDIELVQSERVIA